MENEIITVEEVKNETVPLYEAVFAWAMLLLGFIFTHLAFHYACGIWGAVFRTLFGIAGVAYVKIKKIPVAKLHIAVYAVAVVFGFAPLFCANIFLNLLSAVFSFTLYIYLLALLSGYRPFGDHFVTDLLKSVFERPFKSFSAQPACAFSLLRGKRTRGVLFVLLGVLLSIPLTFVVAALLMSSDDIFESSVSGLIKNFPHISISLVPEVLFAIPVSMYLFGALASVSKPVPVEREKLPSYRVLPPTVGYVMVTPICLFYLYYIGIQIYRIFGGESLMTAAGYSSFARRGFFELCYIAVIDLGVIIFLNTLLKRRENDRKPAALKFFTVFICAATLAIIATALTKMAMYIGELGMTSLRVYTSWFMILLAVIFIIVIALQFVDIPLWKTLFAAFVILFGILCFGNVDGFIANYNINAYQSGELKKADISELYELGFPAAEPALRLYESGSDSEELRKYFEYIKGTDEYFDDVAYFSIPRARAKEALKSFPEK